MKWWWRKEVNERRFVSQVATLPCSDPPSLPPSLSTLVGQAVQTEREREPEKSGERMTSRASELARKGEERRRREGSRERTPLTSRHHSACPQPRPDLSIRYVSTEHSIENAADARGLP
eukprot:1646338-Rhodomonas_salina.1